MEVTNFPRQMSVVQLGEISYYVRSRVECLIPAGRNSSSHYLPATVIHIPNSELSVDLIQDAFDKFLAEDDVFQNSFTESGFLIVKPGTPVSTAQILSKDVEKYLNSRLLSLVYMNGERNLPEGPYFVLDGKVHQAWRLYPDYLEAFTTAVIPDDDATQNEGLDASFRPFNAASFTGSNSVIPVPSRLYAPESSAQPLAGMRITVKDNMHLKGVVTTLGSRSYAELYGKQAQSADYIDRLVRRGAVVIGKTKMSAFAGSEVPPTECIDYFPPWNPRGDGYQSPSGSSSGAAASVAGYPWVDVSICTDSKHFSLRHVLLKLVDMA
ncbi:hypothetical protein N7456_005409 [Penicillium angulare]|uniref:Amidase domain-containing protein n=1 Tax=Penicillium angulare TaxID=116970 RepID=A0A9W9KJA4_9EURO|nr:hypothetical protein N7456_005409 [Penicillium angulare]